MAQEFVEYTESISIITELDKLIQELVRQKIAKVRHDSETINSREQTVINHGNFGMKKFEIDREIFYQIYHLDQWSILRPFDDPLKIIDVKIWYNHSLNRAGVKINRKDLSLLVKMLTDILIVHNKLNNGNNSIDNIAKIAKGVSVAKPIPDMDQG